MNERLKAVATVIQEMNKEVKNLRDKGETSSSARLALSFLNKSDLLELWVTKLKSALYHTHS